MSKEVTYKFLYFVILGTFWLVFGSIVTFLQMFFAPHTNYFEYTKLESTQEVYTIWEDLTLTSHITRENPIYMKYNDILRCQYPDKDWTWFSSTTTYSKNLDRLGSFQSTWRYEWDLPRTPALCYIDSYPSSVHLFGVLKTQNIKSNEFIIIDE